MNFVIQIPQHDLYGYLTGAWYCLHFTTDLIPRAGLVTTLTAGRRRSGTSGVLCLTKLSKVGDRLLAYFGHSLMKIVVIQKTPTRKQTGTWYIWVTHIVLISSNGGSHCRTQREFKDTQSYSSYSRLKFSPEKTTLISWHHPRNDAWEIKRAQKFHSDDVSLARSGEFFWLVANLLQSSTSTIQIWVVASRKYGISALISQTSFRGETSAGGVAKCRLFSQAN